MPLPKKGTPEFAELEKRYLASTKEERNQMAKEYGYAARHNFQTCMTQGRDVLLPRQKKVVIQNDEGKSEPEQTIERKPIVELPPVNFIEYRGKEIKEEGDEEVAILHVGDGHADKITSSYNKDVYRTRMGTMFQSAMTIVKLHRKMYPINKLLILNTGDNIQGENPHQGSKIGDVSMGARDQVKKLAAPMWNDIIGSFKQNFVEVIFEGFPGNHGHDKLAPETSRYDLLLYDILEAGIGQNKGIKININESWCGIIRIWGWKLFGFHGDGIPCQQGVPFFALDRKLKAWHMQFGGFNYAFGGHFHKEHSDEISSRLKYFMVSSLTSDDEWAQKKLGISSNPSQGLYGLHPREGITWRYSLVVDEKFLPESLEHQLTLPVEKSNHA